MVLGALEADLDQEMSVHLRECPACRRSFVESEAIAEAIATVVPDKVAPVVDRLIAERSKPPAPPRRIFTLPNPPRFVSWALVAASILCLIVVARERDGLIDELGHRSTQVSEYRGMLGPLWARSVQQVELRSVHPDTDQAIARAMWSREAGLLLIANNLPEVAGGQCYRVWVLQKAGSPPVSAGTLHVEEGGSGMLYVPPGRELAAAAGFAVTDANDRRLLVGLRHH